MKTRPLSLVLGLVILSLFLTGCVSTPRKTSPSDGLVLIPTAVVNTSGQAFGRKYMLQFEGVPNVTKLQISDYRDSYLLLLVKGPGAKIKGIHSEVDKSLNFVGPDQDMAFEMALPYEPGRMVVTDTTFLLRMERVTSSSYTSTIIPIATDPEVGLTLREKFKANKDNASWFSEE